MTQSKRPPARTWSALTLAAFALALTAWVGAAASAQFGAAPSVTTASTAGIDTLVGPLRAGLVEHGA